MHHTERIINLPNISVVPTRNNAGLVLQSSVAGRHSSGVIFTKYKMTNKKIITAALSVTIIHFLFTSVIGHYIAVQVGIRCLYRLFNKQGLHHGIQLSQRQHGPVGIAGKDDREKVKMVIKSMLGAAATK